MNDFIDMEMEISTLNCVCIWYHTALGLRYGFGFKVSYFVAVYSRRLIIRMQNHTQSISTALSKSFPIQISTCFVFAFVFSPRIENDNVNMN